MSDFHFKPEGDGEALQLEQNTGASGAAHEDKRKLIALPDRILMVDDANNQYPLVASVEQSAAPTINDDETLNYFVGFLWMDTANFRIYRLFDATTGAADWRLVFNVSSPQTAWNFRVATGTITANAGDYILADASSGDVTVTLEATSSLNNGREIQVQRIDDSEENDVTVQRAGSDDLFGANIDEDLPATNYKIEDEGETFLHISDFTRTTWRIS